MLGADPFLASLRRHRLAAGLIVAQAALTTVLLALALAEAGALHARATRPSGLEEAQLAQLIVRGPQDAAAQARERTALGGIDGVAAATPVNQLPFGTEYWSADFSRAPRGGGGVVPLAIYLGDIDLRRQFGVPLRDGRDFLPDEHGVPGVRDARQVQLDADAAQRLFPGQRAVGRTIYLGKRPLQVVGVYAPLQAPKPDGIATMIVPVQYPPAAGTIYLLRLREARLPSADKVAAALQVASPRRWISDYRSLADLRAAYFRQDRWIGTGLLVGLALWLLGTGVGLANLADLMLQSRLRQVGLCRALGARSAQIRWQLRRENLLLAGGGALAGLVLLQGLLHAWPWLGMQLPAGSTLLQMLSAGLVILTGQCAMWPVTREADAVQPAGLLRHA